MRFPAMKPLSSFLFLAQEGRCFHCWEPIPPFQNPGQRHKPGWTWEHIIPKKAGGRSVRNLVLAHHKCNFQRGHQPLDAGQLLRAAEIIELAQYLKEQDDLALRAEFRKRFPQTAAMWQEQSI